MAAAEPIDPDAPAVSDLDTRAGIARERVVVAVISVGGILGAAARYEAGAWWLTPASRFPWTTWGINVAGCALIGVLLVLVSDMFTSHRLLRPFLGTGLLGGFTTFSTYAVDIQRLVATGHAGLALAYLAATVTAAMAAVTAAAQVTRRLLMRPRP